MIRRTLIAAAVAAALGAAGASPAQAATRSCANTYGGDVVSATNVSCREAHKLINGFSRRAKREAAYPRSQFGFSCRNQPSSVEGDTITCRKGSQRVRWYVNIP